MASEQEDPLFQYALQVRNANRAAAITQLQSSPGSIAALRDYLQLNNDTFQAVRAGISDQTITDEAQIDAAFAAIPSNPVVAQVQAQAMASLQSKRSAVK